MSSTTGFLFSVPIGRDVYNVYVVRGPILVDGDSFASFVYRDSKRIVIDSRVPVGERAAVAGCAISHAWRKCVPRLLPVMAFSAE